MAASKEQSSRRSRSQRVSWCEEDTSSVSPASASHLDGHAHELDVQDLWYTDEDVKVASRQRGLEASAAKSAAKAASDAARQHVCKASALSNEKLAYVRATGGLELVESGITDDDISSLLEALDGTRLTAIDLRCNNIGDAGARQLAARLANVSCGVHTLRLWSNRIGIDGVTALAAALQVNQSLTHLDIGKQQCPGSVDGGVHGFGDAAICKMADALLYNTTLTAVDMRFSGIADTGAVALAKALPMWKTIALQRLDLRNNSISAVGLHALALSLAEPGVAPMLHVHIERNAYTDRDAAKLADELDNNPRLAPLTQGQERLAF